MIKLVVCDIDGTLLEKGASVLSEETAEALNALVLAGKQVALASGRSYYSMRRVTERLPFADKLYYICDDGAICVHSGKTLYHKPLSIENLLKFDRDPAYSGCPVLYFSDTFSYVTGATPEFLELIKGNGVDEVRPVSGIYEIKEPVYKIGVYGGRKRPEPLLPQPFDLRVCYHADGWLEYASRFADKGLAVSDLQMRLYLSKFDTAALGDGENDISMFAKAKYTFARRGGHEGLEAAATDTFVQGEAAEVLKRLADK